MFFFLLSINITVYWNVTKKKKKCGNIMTDYTIGFHRFRQQLWLSRVGGVLPHTRLAVIQFLMYYNIQHTLIKMRLNTYFLMCKKNV